MKVQIVIKQGKETKVYTYTWEVTVKKFISDIDNCITKSENYYFRSEKKWVFLGCETVRNSIIEFKEIID